MNNLSRLGKAQDVRVFSRFWVLWLLSIRSIHARRWRSFYGSLPLALASTSTISSKQPISPIGSTSSIMAVTFDELVDITHDDPAYIAANGGRMAYEDMLDRNDPEYEFLAENLTESARHAAF